MPDFQAPRMGQTARYHSDPEQFLFQAPRMGQTAAAVFNKEVIFFQAPRMGQTALSLCPTWDNQVFSAFVATHTHKYHVATPTRTWAQTNCPAPLGLSGQDNTKSSTDGFVSLARPQVAPDGASPGLSFLPLVILC